MSGAASRRPAGKSSVLGWLTAVIEERLDDAELARLAGVLRSGRAARHGHPAGGCSLRQVHESTAKKARGVTPNRGVVLDAGAFIALVISSTAIEPSPVALS